MWLTIPLVGILTTAVLAFLAYAYVKPVWRPAFTATAAGLGLVTVLLSCLATYPAALAIAQSTTSGGYHQFLNGSLVSYEQIEYECKRDGVCKHDYDCDPYEVDDSYTDSNGKKVSASHTEYHDCPQATHEYTFTLTDSIGKVHVIADHIFAANPEVWEDWVRWDRIDEDVPRGIPALWQRGRDSIDQGNPLPVTVDDTYHNYVLSSEKTILQEASGDIEVLQPAGLLPVHTANLTDRRGPIYDGFMADKMSFVGMPPPANAADWQQSLARFNASLGLPKYYGDTHIVAVKASALPGGMSPDRYLQAVKAYWLTGLEKRAIAKNSIIVVLGVDASGRTVEWARAATGMPTGNGEMLRALQFRLEGVAFDPATVIGTTQPRFVASNDGRTVDYVFGNGVIERTIAVDFPFKRACMECKDEGEAEHDGYVYLSKELLLPWWGGLIAIIVQTIVLVAIWFGGFAIALNMTGTTVPRSPYGYSQYDSDRPRSRRRPRIRI